MTAPMLPGSPVPRAKITVSSLPINRYPECSAVWAKHLHGALLATSLAVLDPPPKPPPEPPPVPPPEPPPEPPPGGNGKPGKPVKAGAGAEETQANRAKTVQALYDFMVKIASEEVSEARSNAPGCLGQDWTVYEFLKEADTRGRKDSISGHLYIQLGRIHGASPTLFEASKTHHPLSLRASTAEAEEFVDNVNGILDESSCAGLAGDSKK